MPTGVIAKLFVLVSLMYVLVFVFALNSVATYGIYTSAPTETTQLIICCAVLVDVFAVAVTNVFVLPATVGVPLIVFPLKVKPVGNVFAEY